ncbi:MAG: FtsX-like permease family protein [Bacteroidia bacterium]|nr:FtsX-like permease family protein [Bacteroidia bacterium]
MINNYLKMAIRIMMRQKTYAGINILGLSVGIAASLLIIIYVVDEVGYDKFHNDSERIYRLGLNGRLQGNEFNSATSCAPLAEAMQNEIPEVEETVRFGVWRTMPVSYEASKFTEPLFLVADSNFFHFFSFKLISGNPETVLKGTDKVVITEAAAKKYFGNEDPVGKILLRGSDKRATEVTGVVENPPHNSHIQFDMILSGQSWGYMGRSDEWTSNNLYTYFKARPGASLAKIKSAIDGLIEKNAGAELEKYIGLTFDQFRAQGNKFGMFLQPFLDIHLHSRLSEEIVPNGNIQYLYIFGAIAMFIIVIACINFMNLATARSANRAKEVGVRKTVGAMRPRLIRQFLAESLLYSFISSVIALGLIALTLPTFNYLSGKTLAFDALLNPPMMAGIILFAMLIGLLAGSYPAFYLTAFNPAQVLKGKIRSGFKNSVLRNTLVVVQFMVSITLILGSMVVYKQLRFMQQKNLGFDKENVVDLLHTSSLGKNAGAFKNELLTHPEFAGASYANRLPPNIDWTSAHRKIGTEQDYLLSVYMVDYDHLSTMKYEMIEGRFFSRDFPSDSAAVVINETAMKQMGMESIDGQKLLSYSGESPRPMEIIGVMKDFNYESLRNNVRPMAIYLGGEPNLEMAIRLTPGNTQAQVDLLESVWKKYAPDAAFEYSFLDQNFDALFREEQRMQSIILIFTVLAIGIACLGLFGLATFTAEQRSKELSIRKVLGASSSQVMVLLSKDFTMLVGVAFVLAVPLGWYFLNSWLEGFAYRVGIDFGLIVTSGLFAVIIALVTISTQSIRAARENPVRALKNE